MKSSFLNILIPLFILSIQSCKKTSDSPVFEENIKIEMAENVDSSKRTFNLICNTEKIFGCSNYSIETNHSITGDKITIHFVKISNPGICLTALGPASTIINLNSLSNKVYNLELNFGNQIISGKLTVSEKSYVASLPLQSKVQFVNPDLKRIPNNTIYGKIHYHTSSTSSIAQKFIDSLQFYGATPASYEPGNYRQFEIDVNGEIKQTQDPGYYFTRNFILNYSNNTIQLKDLVRRFGINYPNLLLITLMTTKGETFYSWIP